MAAIHMKHPKLFEFTPLGTINIGDPYTKKGNVPSRYQGKQFQIVPPRERSLHQGYFGEFTYKGDLYNDPKRYLRKQPFDKRVLAFGSHDASKRDEFMDTITTAQYRELLNREKRTIERGGSKIAWEDLEAEEEASQAKAKAKGASSSRGRACSALYDYGRDLVTEPCHKCKRECFFCPHKHQERNLGSYRPTSARYGEAITADKIRRPEFPMPGAIRQFVDSSHLHL